MRRALVTVAAFHGAATIGWPNRRIVCTAAAGADTSASRSRRCEMVPTARRVRSIRDRAMSVSAEANRSQRPGVGAALQGSYGGVGAGASGRVLVVAASSSIPEIPSARQ